MRTAAILAVTIPTTREISYPPPQPGGKGVGEMGITGTAGAVANAVWHATGIRVRKFPIRLDRLIESR